MLEDTGMARMKVVFNLGALIFVMMGLTHGLVTISDLVYPYFFAPVDAGLQAQMASSPLGITSRTTVWDSYIGFNISHSIGLTVFGLLLILIGRHEFGLIAEISWMLPMAVAVPLVYVATSIVFWFFAPAITSGAACACFLYCLRGMRDHPAAQKQKSPPGITEGFLITDQIWVERSESELSSPFFLFGQFIDFLLEFIRVCLKSLHRSFYFCHLREYLGSFLIALFDPGNQLKFFRCKMVELNIEQLQLCRVVFNQNHDVDYHTQNEDYKHPVHFALPLIPRPSQRRILASCWSNR